MVSPYILEFNLQFDLAGVSHAKAGGWTRYHSRGAEQGQHKSFGVYRGQAVDNIHWSSSKQNSSLILVLSLLVCVGCLDHPSLVWESVDAKEIDLIYNSISTFSI